MVGGPVRFYRQVQVRWSYNRFKEERYLIVVDIEQEAAVRMDFVYNYNIKLKLDISRI